MCPLVSACGVIPAPVCHGLGGARLKGGILPPISFKLFPFLKYLQVFGDFFSLSFFFFFLFFKFSIANLILIKAQACTSKS